MALIAAGASFAAWERGVARLEDVEKVQVEAAAALATAQGSTHAQLGALQAQVQDLRARQLAVEAQLGVLVTMSQHLLDQTLEIARATKARRLPAPEED